MIFNSNLTVIKKVKQSFSEEDIKNETMLFSADYEFARKNGEGLTHLFLDNIPKDWKDSKLVIDTRVHMLMPGWYPAIPGWHHDDVPRKGRFGQPNYTNPEYYAEHLMMLINGDIAPTEFFPINDYQLNIPKKGIIYKDWNKVINQDIKDSYLLITKVPDSTIIKFDWQSFHRASPCIKRGWRYFIRASRYWKDKEMTIPDYQRFQRRTGKNQIRRQVQIYLSELEKGW